MSITSASASIVSLLENNWDSDNTSGVTPIIERSWNVQTLLGNLSPNSAGITVYERLTTIKHNSMGTVSRETKTPVTIDMVTRVSEELALEIFNEIDRIVKENMINPDTNYDILNFERWTPFHDMRNPRRLLWRFAYEVILEKSNELL